MTDRPRCPNCDKLIRPVTKTVQAPREPNSHRPVRDWCYTGNLQVVAREYSHLLFSPDGKDWVERDAYKQYDDDYYADWSYEKRLRSVSVWDGESYRPVYGVFCSNNCAAAFGRLAYRAGYRLKKET